MKTIFIFLVTLFICATVFSQDEKQLNVLVFSKTVGYRHASISSGLKIVYDLSKEENWLITATENSSLITDEFLANFDVAVFLNPTQDVFDEKQQKAFEQFIANSKGFVGVHAAADCEYDWPRYGQLNGAYFRTHPPAQEATIIIEDTSHPAMKPFEGMKTYTTFDEWYSFKENPRDKVNVLARLDESTIKESKDDKWKMGDHPLIWWQDLDGSRSFYTVFGHTHEAFQNKLVIEHIKAAINWAGKRIN